MEIPTLEFPFVIPDGQIEALNAFLLQVIDLARQDERQAIIQAINAPDAFPQSRTGWDAGDALDAVVELIYARGRKSSNL